MRHQQTLRTFIRTIIVAEAFFNSAWAGPPFVTDDPEPVEYRRWEVNYAASKTLRSGSASAAVPSIDMNYGLLPDVQLHAQPRYALEKNAAGRNLAIDDTEIGVKYRFLNVERGNSTIMAGIYPLYQMPTGDVRLGPGRGKGQGFLPLWLQRNSGKWAVYGGAGYRINPGAGNRNSVFVGGSLLYQFTPALQFGAEVFHETANSLAGHSNAGFNLGGRYGLATDYNLLFSTGKGISNVSISNQYSLYAALQVLY